MKININNEEIIIKAGSSVDQMVEQVDSIPKSGIAVAINQEVIPQSLWGSKVINTNDNVLIIQATQGG
tara:strand:+ start:252 stop:455 length:204 start_codon:yes stop_codon:yes gene_type:complete